MRENTKKIEFQADSTYKGWVPTVTGRLSFTLVGESSYPSKTACVNRADNQNRYVICSQSRSELDTVLPFKKLLSRLALGYDGRSVGVCVARASNDPTRKRADLSGHVLWFGKRAEWKRAKPILEEMRACVEGYFNGASSRISIEDVDGLLRRKTDALCDLSDFHAPFCLTRNGEFTLHSYKEMAVSVSAPDFSDRGKEKEHERDVICAQLFYFVKDIAHTHQHHSPKSDSLITLYRVGSNPERWKNEVIRSLTLSVLRMKRHRGHYSATGALGVLSYVRSFRSLFDSHEKPLIPDFTEEYLEKSVQAAADQETERLAHQHRKSDTIRNTIISLAGLMVSIASLYSITTRGDPSRELQPHPLLIDVGRLLTEHTPWVLGGTFLWAMAVWTRSGIFGWEKWGLTRGSLRLVIPLGKRAAVGVFGLAAVLAVYSGMVMLTGSY